MQCSKHKITDLFQNRKAFFEPGPVKYIYIRTEAELSMALEEFKFSNYRYLHISCHGSDSIALTLDLPRIEAAVEIVHNEIHRNIRVRI